MSERESISERVSESASESKRESIIKVRVYNKNESISERGSVSERDTSERRTTANVVGVRYNCEWPCMQMKACRDANEYICIMNACVYEY